MAQEIRRAAGDVWHYLNSNGASTIERIKEALHLNEAVLFMAVGWLAREGKLSFEMEGKNLRISLSQRAACSNDLLSDFNPLSFRESSGPFDVV